MLTKVENIHKFDLSGQAFKRDPFPTFQAMQEKGVFVKSKMPLIGEVTYVTRQSAAKALLKRSDLFSVDFGRVKGSFLLHMLTRMPGLRPLMDNMMQNDDPKHRRLRKLVDGVFRRQEIQKLVPKIEIIANQLFDNFIHSDDKDVVRHIARDLPLAVICELLGLPQRDRPKFTSWMRYVAEDHSLTGMMSLLPSVWRINNYLKLKFEERCLEPRDDLISDLVNAEEDGDRLSEDELLAMCFLLFVAGHETTAHLISGGVLSLIENPEQLELLRQKPDLMPLAVDELLRFVCPVQMSKPRYPIEDCEFEGVRLKKGEPVLALLASANIDPDEFDTPLELNVGREHNPHLALGGGPHFCLGAWLAKSEMEIMLKCILERLPVLALACQSKDLHWTSRTGLRALRSLPLSIKN